MPFKSHSALVPVITLTLATACTENERSRTLGGTMSVKVPCDQQVFDVTWKEGSLWYATQPAGKGWEPQTKVFMEASAFGVMEGKVLLAESKCRP